MKKFWVFLFLSFCFSGLAQFQDNFSDGDFTQNPTWIGNTDSFVVNTNQALQLDAPANTQESYLATASQGAVSGSWEFYVHLAFNPSGSNKAYIYLMADQSNLKNALDGYYVLVGNTTDEVSLYRQDGNTSTKIIDGVDGTVATQPKVRIKVTRDIQGNFELFCDTSVNFNHSISQGTVLDNTYVQSQFFGVLCDYTATRSNKFFFDDFIVTTQAFVDVFPPKLLHFSILNKQSIQLFFDENLDSATAQNTHRYILNTNENPQNIIFNNNDNSVQLNFSNPLQANTNYSLQINQIADLHHNFLDTTFTFQLKNAYHYNQVIFNEIMADENPSYGLPLYEFIEIRNLSTDTLFTQNWFLADLTDTCYLPTDTLLPDSFALLGSNSSKPFYAHFGKAIGISNFISLNKSEDNIKLYDRYGNILDSLHYFDDWYSNQTAPNGTPKADGGWSLERIRSHYPCSASNNWIPSQNPLGGSPGKDNAIEIVVNSIAPQIENAYFITDSSIKIIFDQEIVGASNPQNYTLNGNHSISNVLKESPKSYLLILSTLWQANTDYLLKLHHIENCDNVAMLQNSTTLFLLKKPHIGDLVLNEILYNAYSNASDFVEIYNTTNQMLNLKGFSIKKYDIFETDTITDFSIPFTEDFIIEPASYYTFTQDTQSVFQHYVVDKPQWLVEYKIPNFSDKEGVLALVLDDSIVLDKLHYYSRWAFELLDNENGVSLERLSTKDSTQNTHNWASAAKAFGYATPTAKNSQVLVEQGQNNSISIQPEVFTPNQDGVDDYAQIHYQLEQAGYVANVAVYDVVGRKIKDLAINETIGSKGFWKWDGTNTEQQKAKIGIYLIVLDLFDLSGKKKQYKEKVVLGGGY